MSPRQRLCFLYVFSLFVIFTAGQAAAQQESPPGFALGDVHGIGKDQLNSVSGRSWSIPDDPFAPPPPPPEVPGLYLWMPVSGYPLLGDWNGDGKDTPGVFTSLGVFHLSTDLSGDAGITFAFGQGDDIPVVGDWDGDGVDTVGVYRAGTWYLTNNHSASGVLAPIRFGTDADYPVAGDWDSDGVSTLGFYSAGVFTLSDDLFGTNLRFVPLSHGGGRPVTFYSGNGDGVALVVLPGNPVGDIPNPNGKIIIRPGPGGDDAGSQDY